MDFRELALLSPLELNRSARQVTENTANKNQIFDYALSHYSEKPSCKWPNIPWSIAVLMQFVKKGNVCNSGSSIIAGMNFT